MLPFPGCSDISIYVEMRSHLQKRNMLNNILKEHIKDREKYYLSQKTLQNKKASTLLLLSSVKLAFQMVHSQVSCSVSREVNVFKSMPLHTEVTISQATQNLLEIKQKEWPTELNKKVNPTQTSMCIYGTPVRALFEVSWFFHQSHESSLAFHAHLVRPLFKKLLPELEFLLLSQYSQ